MKKTIQFLIKWIIWISDNDVVVAEDSVSKKRDTENTQMNGLDWLYIFLEVGMY